jgi:hypothetical protein
MFIKHRLLLHLEQAFVNVVYVSAHKLHGCLGGDIVGCLDQCDIEAD